MGEGCGHSRLPPLPLAGSLPAPSPLWPRYTSEYRLCAQAGGEKQAQLSKSTIQVPTGLLLAPKMEAKVHRSPGRGRIGVEGLMRPGFPSDQHLCPAFPSARPSLASAVLPVPERGGALLPPSLGPSPSSLLFLSLTVSWSSKHFVGFHRSSPRTEP